MHAPAHFRIATLVGGTRSAWWRYLVLAAIPMAFAPWFLQSQWEQTGLTVAVGYASGVLCLWRYRTGRGVAGAWLWIGAGVALNASGSIAESLQMQILGRTTTPSPADALYLALYPCVSVGLLMIVRARYPGLGRAKAIDASALTVGLGLLCWVFLIRPAAASASGSVLVRAVDVAYPVGDLMLIAILARVMAAGGWRTPTVRLVSLSLLGFLLGDSAWALINNNNWSTSNVVNTALALPFLLAYALIGAAALHPSAAELETPAVDDADRSNRALLASILLASLIAPAILAFQALSGRVTDGVAIAVCSAQLTLLVVARLAHLLAHLQKQSERLRELALEDDLTGLPNRRALEGYLSHGLQRARRDRQTVSLALLDLDRFKAFNDQHGHLAGDQLLKSAASAWGKQIRTTDMLARIGGEEFVLVLPDADIGQATAVLTKLRASTPLGQTFSAGVAEWDNEALADELLSAADAAMYRAKRAGRDRIEPAGAGAR
jgi:diguanylate cyclase (GGDEF)-like protein